MSSPSKRYSYIPTGERTKQLYEQVRNRFYELIKEETELDSQRARHLSKSYYIEIIAREFTLSVSSVHNIVNSGCRQ